LEIILKPLKPSEMEARTEAVAMIFYTKMQFLEKKNSFSTNSISKCQRKTCCNNSHRRIIINSNSFINLDHIKLLLRNYSTKMQGEDKV
jgi:hypothetical protein